MPDKRIVFILLSLVMAVMVSCKNNNEGETNSIFVGKWKYKNVVDTFYTYTDSASFYLSGNFSQSKFENDTTDWVTFHNEQFPDSKDSCGFRFKNISGHWRAYGGNKPVYGYGWDYCPTDGDVVLTNGTEFSRYKVIKLTPGEIVLHFKTDNRFYDSTTKKRIGKIIHCWFTLEKEQHT